MKLLFLTTVYPTKSEPFRGVYIQNRAKALRNKGINVKIAFFSQTASDEMIDSFAYMFNYSIFKLGFLKRTKIDNGPFKEFLFDYKPDLIIFFIAPLSLEKRIILFAPSFKFGKFFEGRNIYYEYSSKFPRFIQFLLCLKKKNIIKKMSYIFLCSGLLEKDFYSKKYRKSSFKVFTLENGFDQSIFVPITKPKVFDDNKFRVIAVGNLLETKGFIYLLKSLNETFQNVSRKVEITIVGSGPLEDSIRAYKLSNNISLKVIKQLSQKDLLVELRNNDYFILPSVYESFGCVYLAAMSQGLVTIGCKGQGPSTFINNGKNGFLVSGFGPDLHDLLVDIVENRIDLKIISKNAIACSKKYSWDAFAETFIKNVILE